MSGLHPQQDKVVITPRSGGRGVSEKHRGFRNDRTRAILLFRGFIINKQASSSSSQHSLGAHNGSNHPRKLLEPKGYQTNPSAA